eukprot:m.16960 g.16960  ORF g.16960 m.16960 type:complete len:234 (+) comp3194_c0_seq1:2-703(+)
MVLSVFGVGDHREKLALLYGTAHAAPAAIATTTAIAAITDAPAASTSSTAAAPAPAAKSALLEDASTTLLLKLGIPLVLFEHPSSPTINDWRPHIEALAPRGAKMCKNLFLKDRKQPDLLLVVALADTAVDMKLIQKRFAFKNPRLAAEEVLLQTLGLQKGAVTPLAMVADSRAAVTLVLDKALVDSGATPLCFHPISGNNFTVVLTAAELLRYVEACGRAPVVVDFLTDRID